MTELYLSKARLAAQRDRLGPIFFPQGDGERMAISHRLVWTLFPRDLKERPFLYRETSSGDGKQNRGEFLILSRMRPDDAEGLFDLDTQVFAPQIRSGEYLQFSLRANPTSQKTETVEGKRKTRRYDVVMKALHGVPTEKRAEARAGIIRKAGIAWLGEQSKNAGFSLPDNAAQVRVGAYQQVNVSEERVRQGQHGRAAHSRLDFDGVLKVEDPSLFIQKIASGFGRARAFGHGLMLIRRA
jgi:CRISPR system Cascade subunit CasE